jgi:fumarylpyruvate hydrolase
MEDTMTLLFEPPARPAALVEGSSALFPVERIFCVGRNYLAHAQEMGSDLREPPFFFTKFPQALVAGGGAIAYPPATKNFHHEGELVIAIGCAGFCVSAEAAPSLVYGYAAGLDMTRRDLQFAARDKGRPWDTGKNFAHSAPLGPIRPVEGHGHVAAGALRLTVNGTVKQEGRIEEMIWSPAEVIAHLSRLERLLPGDLIFTGTPSGVGPVVPGDIVELSIEGLSPLVVRITEPEPEGA